MYSQGLPRRYLSEAPERQTAAASPRGGNAVPALKLFLVVLCLVALGGCIFARGTVGEEFTKEGIEAFESFQNGVTTRAEVAARIGAPTEVVPVAGREIYHYRRLDAKLGLILFFSRANIASDNLYILFDKDGIVEDVIFGKRTDRLEFQVWPFGE